MKTIYICGADEVNQFSHKGISGFIRISNPDNPQPAPEWFKGKYLQLLFGDVFSGEDAITCKTRAADIEDIQAAIDFAIPLDSVLISCDYGASRSPAIAVVIFASQMEVGKEKEVIDAVMEIRPDSVPNEWVVLLGDKLLNRGGKLLKALQSSYDFEISMMYPPPPAGR